MATEIIFVILVFLVFIGIVIYLVLRGDSVIHTGKHLSKKSADAQTAKGYGSYQKVYESPCSTIDGKCNNPGVKWITEYCVPHPDTGRGCLNENGEQTFAPRSTNQSCKANCRSFIFSENTTLTNSICNYDEPFNTFNCIPPNASSYQYRSFTCTKNDTIGDNTCTYKCGSAGVQSNGVYGDADSSLISYFPVCAAKPGSTIIFNHIPWNTIYNLGKNGYLTSLGYTIKNILNTDGTVNKTKFSISPAYPPWGPSGGSNVITYENLITLDQNLTIYENCTPNNIKPTCDNYFVYTPEEIESNITRVQEPSICKLSNTYYPIKDCFYNPWYSLPTVIQGQTGLDFENPYVGSTGGNTGAAYTWTNIGNYGYIAIPTTCSDKPVPALPGPSGGFIIPDTPIDNAVCLNMSLPPKQCSTSYTNMFSVSPSITAAQFETKTTPVIPQSYPQTIGTTNFLCATEYPDGTRPVDDNNNVIPGCIQTCQYLPNNEEINFLSTDVNGNTLGHTALYDLLGKYVYINYIDSTNRDFFLTVNNIECGSTGGYLPLQNCSNNPSPNPVPLTFVYTGGTGIAAGNYWSKNNCDDESIVEATNIQLLFSPRFAINSPLANVYGFACDIYANVGGLNGYLTAGTSTSTNIDINNAFFGSNIVASYNLSTSSSVYFNPLAQGEQIPNTSYTDPHFILFYDANTGQFNISSFNPQQSLAIDQYDGTTTILGNIPFTFVTTANKTTSEGYYKTLGYNQPIIKSPGSLYAGQNVTRSINIQRNNQCYTYSLCESSQSSGFCYPDTCNLFYNFTPEFC